MGPGNWNTTLVGPQSPLINAEVGKYVGPTIYVFNMDHG